MKSRFSSLSGFAGALGLGALLLGAGCYISHEAVKENELPAEWQTALNARTSTPEAFAGTYQNIGQRWTRWMNRPGEGPRQIRDFLWLAPGENSRGTSLIRTVELVVLSPTQLKFITREGGQVLNEEIRDVEWNAKNRAFAYRKNGGIGQAGSQGPTVSWGSSHLYKGADGNLYAEWFSGEAGPSVYGLPVSITHGEWSQWKPAAPATATRR